MSVCSDAHTSHSFVILSAYYIYNVQKIVWNLFLNSPLLWILCVFRFHWQCAADVLIDLFVVKMNIVGVKFSAIWTFDTSEFRNDIYIHHSHSHYTIYVAPCVSGFSLVWNIKGVWRWFWYTFEHQLIRNSHLCLFLLSLCKV